MDSCSRLRESMPSTCSGAGRVLSREACDAIDGIKEAAGLANLPALPSLRSAAGAKPRRARIRDLSWPASFGADAPGSFAAGVDGVSAAAGVDTGGPGRDGKMRLTICSFGINWPRERCPGKALSTGFRQGRPDNFERRGKIGQRNSMQPCECHEYA